MKQAVRMYETGRTYTSENEAALAWLWRNIKADVKKAVCSHWMVKSLEGYTGKQIAKLALQCIFAAGCAYGFTCIAILALS